MEKNLTSEFKTVPVSVFIAVSLVLIFSLYLTSAIKAIPCSKNVIDNFLSNFVHTDLSHILANLYALYALSRVEIQLGPKKFFTLVIFFLLFNSIFETILHRIKKDIPCSIGFSGVLFGIMTWEIVSNKGLDFYIITAIAGMVILPSLQNSKVSFSGHLIGAVSGILGGLLWNKIN